MAITENLKIIRILGGEEIMAEVLERNKEVIRVKNPIRVVVMPNKADPKNPQVGLAPFGEFSEDKEFDLNAALVLVVMTPAKEFVNQYNSLFGGIVLPTQGIIGATGN